MVILSAFPADRFFEIDTALKHTLEHGVEENTLELALRGQPRDPFYMVGRMGDQSVVIRAEKGQVKMLVDDNKELVYDATKESYHENQTNPSALRAQAKDNGRTVHLDTAKNHQSNLPGDVDQLYAIGPVAEPGHGRDAQCPVAQKAGAGPIESTVAATDRQENHRGQSGQTGEPIEEDPNQGQLIPRADYEKQSQTKGAADHEGQLRTDDGN